MDTERKDRISAHRKSTSLVWLKITFLAGGRGEGGKEDDAASEYMVLLIPIMLHTLSWPRWAPGQFPYVTWGGTTEKAESLSLYIPAISVHFQDKHGRLGKAAWPKLVLIPGLLFRASQTQSPWPGLMQRASSTGGAEAWSCVFLSRHCSH